jgi:tRNA dimethylallyltransferase
MHFLEMYNLAQARPRLVLILGPTAVGKTETALHLAQRLNGEIVSADSRLFYRGMDIGTAKPSREELALVPHHLIDIVDPDETLSLAVFQKMARDAIAGITARGRLPFLVGGTGQYVRAVVEGWDLPRVEADPALRAILEAWAGEVGADGLHQRLAALDPAAAAAIDYHNLRRTVRALEVIFSTGRRFSEQRGSGPSLYDLFQLGLTRPRPELYARIDARIEAMLAGGLVDEVRGLLAGGYSPDLPAFSAIGYREVIACLQGRISLEEAQMLMKRLTRQFVRRQTNWFKETDPQIRWFQPGVTAEGEIESLIRAWISG